MPREDKPVPLIITVPDDIAREAEAIAQRSGTTAQELLIQALQAHFPPLSPELRAEFDAWEQASDEDMAKLTGQSS
jgi:hypothetical protein